MDTEINAMHVNPKHKPRADCKLSQKQYRIKIYMMHEQIQCHDACTNAVNN